MTISQLPPSKRSPYDPSSNIKLNLRKTKVFKMKLVGNAPTVVKHYKAVKIKREEIDNVEKHTISYESKVDKSCASLSTGKAKLSALNRANEIQAKLPSEYPSLMKFMLHSHVSGGFWLSLPKQFCDSHLPKCDETVILVDEGEEEHKVKYLANKNGLSGGWRGFSIEHKLCEGDVVVFQLIKPCRFKHRNHKGGTCKLEFDVREQLAMAEQVYIVRANKSTEIDRATSLPNLDIQAKSIHSVCNFVVTVKNEIEEVETAADQTLEPYVDNSDQDDNQEKREVAINPGLDPSLEQFGNESDDCAEVLDGIRFSESAVEFKDVKGFENFSILVDDLIIDSEIPIHLRTKYYELCCSQNSFLHDHLVKGLNCKLAAGIVSETVNIADAIRAAKLATSCDLLQTWDKTLKAFEDMGMKVGFLRERLKKLLYFSIEQRETMVSKRLERVQVEHEMKNLEAKYSKAKEAMRTLDAEILALREKNQMLGLTFSEVAAAPW